MYLLSYGELALKWWNRKLYEKKLMENINFKLKDKTDKKVYHSCSRIWLEEDNEQLKSFFSHIPWLVSFSYWKKTKPEISAIKKIIKENFLQENFESFKVYTQRRDKSFYKTSVEINIEIGEYVQDITSKKVDLNSPEKVFYIILTKDFAFVSDNKIPWVWGLPVWTSWKVVSLLSWWIDSPVSSYLMMKRWCEVVFAHWFNKTVQPEKVREKIYKLAEKLSEYQINTKLYLLPYGLLQKELVEKVPEKWRMLLFRRSVKRLWNFIAEAEWAKALVSGDSLSQVASQTIENIFLANQVSNIPVFSPLIGLDKLEIVNFARKIWTYEISNLPYEDCCSLIASKHPVIKWKRYFVEKFEEKINLKEIEKDIFEEAIVKKF